MSRSVDDARPTVRVTPFRARCAHLIGGVAVNGEGLYRAAEVNAEALGRTYDDLAALLNCRADEIALLDSSTRAWTQAFYALEFRPGPL